MSEARWSRAAFAAEARAWTAPAAARASEFLAAWAWVGADSRENGDGSGDGDGDGSGDGGFLARRDARRLGADRIRVETHVAWSPAYEAPTLWYRATREDDPAVDETHRVEVAPDAPVGPELHPVLDEWFYSPHPCMAAEAAALVAVRGDRERVPGERLLAWWSVAAPLIRAGLSPADHVAVLEALLPFTIPS